MAKRLLPAFGSCLSCELAVADAPKIACYSTEAIIGDKNVHVSCEVRAKPRLFHTQTNSPGAAPERGRSHVSCEVRAKPRLSALFWIVDANGTALAEPVMPCGWEGNRGCGVALAMRHGARRASDAVRLGR